MAAALFRPLTPQWGMQKHWTDGSRMHDVAAEFIKPNDRLSSFERLEIYNRQYWFRVLDCFWDDYPGLRAIVGERKFAKLITAYLERYPSNSYTLRDLGNRLERFLREERQWAAPREELAIDMACFEWAQVVAFDGPSKAPISPDDILDTPPSKLRLALQPYLSLLDLDYAVDDFLIVAIRRSQWLTSVDFPTPAQATIVMTLTSFFAQARSRKVISSSRPKISRRSRAVLGLGWRRLDYPENIPF
jgi:hypothetical protein